MKVKSESEVPQLCLTLLDPMDCSPPGSSIHGIFQARILQWGAIAFSPLRDRLPELTLSGQMASVRANGKWILYDFLKNVFILFLLISKRSENAIPLSDAELLVTIATKAAL